MSIQTGDMVSIGWTGPTRDVIYTVGGVEFLRNSGNIRLYRDGVYIGIVSEDDIEINHTALIRTHISVLKNL